MARKRRDQQVELNFDGLADSVTNLVGALILLVVLIIGMTDEAGSQESPKPNPRPDEGKQDAGERSILSLQQRITVLQTQVRGVDQEVEAAGKRLKDVRDEVEELLEKVQQVQPPKDDQPKPKPKENVARKVPFRPPFERLDIDRKTVSFVIQDGRISFLDFEALNKVLKEEKDSQGKTNKGAKSFVVDRDIPGSEFKVQGRYSDNNDEMSLTVVKQPGVTGESLEDIQRPDSRFRRKLASLKPAEDIISFSVYPDSFEVYRKARVFAWDSKLDVGWSPQPAGEQIKLGRGGVGSSQ